MRTASWVGPAVSIALLGVASGCGSDEARTDAVADATAADAGQDEEPPFTWSDATPPPDVHVPKPSEVGLLDGGGPFMCGVCVCDGRTHYCDFSSAGASMFPGDAGPCPDASSQCVPLPPECVPATCACLPNGTKGPPCACFHSQDGDGLLAGCVYP